MFVIRSKKHNVRYMNKKQKPIIDKTLYIIDELHNIYKITMIFSNNYICIYFLFN
jgi:hypothetical protein